MQNADRIPLYANAENRGLMDYFFNRFFLALLCAVVGAREF